MTARFAGAQTLDQRRRRRLAQNSSETAEDSVTPGLAADSSEQLPSEFPQQLPDDSVIPRSLWKVVGAIVGGVCCWAGILWAGLATIPAELGLRTYVTLDGGRLTEFFSTVSLIVAAELCFVIFWYRSRSRKDFLGRYRVWAWAGFFLGATCFLSATGLHHPLARLLIDRYPLQIYRPELTYWLLPFGVCFLATHRILAVEMRQARASEIGWNLMLIAGAAVMALEFGVMDRIPTVIPAAYQTAISSGVVMLWHFLIAATLLVHARFVIHVTNEVGPRKSSLPIRLYRRILATLRSGRKTAGATDPANETAKPKPKSRKAEATPPAETRSNESSPAEKSKPTPVRTQVAVETEADLAADAAKAAKRRVLGQNVRVDAPAAQAPAPHVPVARPAASSSPAASSKDKQHEDFDYDEDEEDYSLMSRKDRKRMKKAQRSRDDD